MVNELELQEIGTEEGALKVFSVVVKGEPEVREWGEGVIKGGKPHCP